MILFFWFPMDDIDATEIIESPETTETYFFDC